MAELRAALSEVTSQSRADSSSRSSRRPGDQARAKAVVAVVTAALGRLQVALGPQHLGSERAVADGMAAPPAVPA